MVFGLLEGIVVEDVEFCDTRRKGGGGEKVVNSVSCIWGLSARKCGVQMVL